jgi:hypothetical protein
MPPTPRRPNAAASSSAAAARSTLGQGLGKGGLVKGRAGVGGKGLGKALAKRHRKVMKDTIRGISMVLRIHVVRDRNVGKHCCKGVIGCGETES